MSAPQSVNTVLFWFRRDLRLADNAGLYHALKSAARVHCVFVFDRDILDAEGKFIRRYVPELAKVPDKYIHAPWTLSPPQQKLSGCIIGEDYPAPIVDHDIARREALALYKSV